MTTTTITTKRRTQRASEEAQGMLATGGVPTVLPGGPMGQRCLSALRALTLQRVQRSCGGFSEDDISWQMRTMEDIGEVLGELEEAGLIRSMGWDDEDEVACYALPLGHAVRGIAAGATRYGPEQLVALIEVELPPLRESPGWELDRIDRLNDWAAKMLVAGFPNLTIALNKRILRCQQAYRHNQRRFLEGYSRRPWPGWVCRSLVVVRGIADVGDRGCTQMGRGAVA